MAGLEWCCRQKDGIRLVEPNENLAKEYMKNSEETLFSLKGANEDSNMWRATKKYYAEYLAVYALLIRMGIKCEIHDCTIELVKILKELRLFPEETHKILFSDKKLRIDNQYYLKNIPVGIDYEELLNFVLEIKEKITTISPDEIKLARDKIKGIC